MEEKEMAAKTRIDALEGNRNEMSYLINLIE